MRKTQLLKQNKRINKTLLFLVISLTLLGLIAVADASAPQALNVFKDKYYFVKQQIFWAFLGFVVLFIASKVNYSFWKKLAAPLFWTSLLILFLVLIPGLGMKALGARRWLVVGSFNFQPSELVKFTLAVYLAKVAERKRQVMAFFLPLFSVCLLIILQPDLGTALIIMAMGMSQIFISGINLFYFLSFAIFGGISSLLLIFTSDYRKNRLLTFLQHIKDPLGRDYHLRQILLALGSGGLFGVGLGQSRQKFLFLPEAATDSVFAIIAEEVGFIGSIVIIFLFIWLIVKCLSIAKNAPDEFSRVLAIGLSAWIGGQVLLNIGSMVAITPLTGVPLPFFSYGGSALIMILFACGILLNISKSTNEQ